jgi:hypothetical protein
LEAQIAQVREPVAGSPRDQQRLGTSSGTARRMSAACSSGGFRKDARCFVPSSSTG